MHPMGVLTGAVSMTTTSNGVYNHKKFKRATSELCDIAESGTCGNLHLNKPLFTRCNSNSGSLSVDRDKSEDIGSLDCRFNPKFNCNKCSFHVSTADRDLQCSNPCCSRNNVTYCNTEVSRGDRDFCGPAKRSKSLYKPKFCGQYVSQHSGSVADVPATTSDSIIKIQEYCRPLITTSKPDSDASNQQSTYAALQINVVPKSYEVNKSSAVPSRSSLWKNIKSPSPELVEQHINNLIVKNQSIIDNHNPLWPRRYRRQSSVSSSSSESECSSGAKSQRSNLSEIQLKPKFVACHRAHSPVASALHKDIDASSTSDSVHAEFTRSYSPCLPQSPVGSISAAVSSASKAIISTSVFLKAPSVPLNQHSTYYSTPSASFPHETPRKQVLHEIMVHDLNSRGVQLLECPVSSQHPGDSHQAVKVSDSTVIVAPSGERVKFSPYLSGSHSSTELPEDPEYSEWKLEGHLMYRPLHSNTIECPFNAHSLCSSPPSGSRLSHQVHYEIKEGNSLSKYSTVSHEQQAALNLNKLNSVSVDLFPSKRRKISVEKFGCHQVRTVLVNNGQAVLNFPYDEASPLMPSAAFPANQNRDSTGVVDQDSDSLDLCLSKTSKGDVSHPSSIVTIAKSALNSGGTVQVENPMTEVKSCSSLSTLGLQSASGSSDASCIRSSSECYSSKSECIPKLGSAKNPHAPLLELPNLSVPGIPAPKPGRHFSVTPKISRMVTSPVPHLIDVSKPVVPLVGSSVHDVSLDKISDSFTTISDSQPEILYPNVIAVGTEKVRHVPGIPGPYSQACMVTLVPHSRALSELDAKVKNSQGLDNLLSTDTTSNGDKGLNMQSNLKYHKKCTNSISVIPAEIFCSNNDSKDVPHPENCEVSSPKPVTTSGTFNVVLQRPNTLPLNPSLGIPKMSLVGSTIASPDTPRPKKTCAQHVFNGSAYTFLGLKVSTKSFYCCIYRPQPMYVLQSTNPKLSMYSNWQIRKSPDDIFNLNVTQMLSLYVSRSYSCNMAYTIAKPKQIQMIYSDSSYWTEGKKKLNAAKATDDAPIDSGDIDEDGMHSIDQDNENEASEKNSKRVKIFEGGFQSNEDYTYVRGRGRGRYICDACGIRCKKPSMLKKHLRTHTDLRPFACVHCSFSFKTKGNLTKHLKSKAHYKRCIEMGIKPVPTTVDESHVNEAVLALQEKFEKEKSKVEEGGEYDEDDEDDDEDDDEEEADDEQFEDAEDTAIDNSASCLSGGVQSVSSNALCAKQDSVSYPGVVVLNPCASKVVNDDSRSEDMGPVDLSVKKTGWSIANSISSGIASQDTALNLSCTSVSSLSSAVQEATSDILSPVTESSLLNSIYNTTQLVSQTTLNVRSSSLLLDPYIDISSPQCLIQFQNYHKEKALHDAAIKRHQLYQFKPSHVDDITCTRDYANHYSNCGRKAVSTAENTNVSCSEGEAPTVASEPEKILPSTIIPVLRVKHVQSLIDESTQTAEKESSCVQVLLSISKQQENSMLVSVCQSASSTVINTTTASTMLPTTNIRLHTPPTNLTVLKQSGDDATPSFLLPSGVVVSSSNSRVIHDDGKCKCNFCPKEFRKDSQLKLHMNIHYIERPYRCDSCTISFRTNGHLKKHKRSASHFNKVKCNKTFGVPSTDNPRPFKCLDCEVAFRIHGHLAKHLRSKMHIMKLECLGKLPFGTYAEIEHSGANLNEINTADCENSLRSLQNMALKLFEKEPGKLTSWQRQQVDMQVSSSLDAAAPESSDDEVVEGVSTEPCVLSSDEKRFSARLDAALEIIGRDSGKQNSVVAESSAGCTKGSLSSLTHVPVTVGSNSSEAVQGLIMCSYCTSTFGKVEQLVAHCELSHPSQSLRLKHTDESSNIR